MRPATCLLLICCSLSFWTNCKPKIQTVPVAIGEARIVGRWTDLKAQFEPGVDLRDRYLIVTEAFWLTAYRLVWKVRELELEIKKLEAKKEK